jgi:hypothetical protein
MIAAGEDQDKIETETEKIDHKKYDREGMIQRVKVEIDKQTGEVCLRFKLK